MTMSVTLPPEFEERLSALARKTGHAREDQLKWIISQGLEDMEDYYAAQDVLDRVRRGEEKVVSSEDIWRGLGC
ncbi:CopG family transcriptional regulator [Rhizobium sp. FKL33]|uniref:type II toxin-antitoxin system RelB family antitoxin n=1 Tax=Rhizobium sp. FKL33 TaxID=2562307 RepID=UPI0010C07BFB|nr:CopG family transcriptional regulator [Rhizobium sp. FKL33]